MTDNSSSLMEIDAENPANVEQVEIVKSEISFEEQEQIQNIDVSSEVEVNNDVESEVSDSKDLQDGNTLENYRYSLMLY